MIRSRKKKNLNSLTFQVLPEQTDVHASQSQTILDALLQAQIDISHGCGGMGTCGTCRIYVEKGIESFAPRSEAEAEIAQQRQFTAKERLSCQNLAVDRIQIRIPIQISKN